MAQKSIQGERQDERATRYADPEFIAEYEASCSEGVRTCRWRGRHDYPIEATLDFDRVREDGLLERELVCVDCGCAIQVQLWEPIEVTVGRRKVPQVRFLVAFVTYQQNVHGETYVSTQGVITTKAFRAAVAARRLSAEATSMVREALRVTKRNEGQSANRKESSR